MFPCVDIHTHDKSRKNAIINIYPNEELIEGVFHSVGIHPWQTANISSFIIKQLNILAAHPQIVAIGETGIDSIKGASIDIQIEIFKLHVNLSEQYKKPLIIHCVKSFNEIIVLKNKLCPTMPWIIHGFRGKPQLAKDLLKHGFFISLGENFNTETASFIPDNKLLFESDESTLDIDKIIEKINLFR